MNNASTESKCFWCRVGVEVKRMLPLFLVAVALIALISENSKKESKQKKVTYKSAIHNVENRSPKDHVKQIPKENLEKVK